MGKFLIYRVELKVIRWVKIKEGIFAFLIYRVELKESLEQTTQ